MVNTHKKLLGYILTDEDKIACIPCSESLLDLTDSSEDKNKVYTLKGFETQCCQCGKGIVE